MTQDTKKEAVGHTDGPWLVQFDGFDEKLHVSSQDRLDGDKVEIASISVGYADQFEAEQQANARLIAAAPEMLEALKAAYALIDDVIAGDDPDMAIAKMVDVVGDAISKAEGRAS